MHRLCFESQGGRGPGVQKIGSRLRRSQGLPLRKRLPESFVCFCVHFWFQYVSVHVGLEGFRAPA